MAGRETGVVRKRLLGDPELAIRYIGPARTLLGILKNDMAFNRLDQGLRRATIPIEEVIESGPIRRPSSEAGSTDTGRNDRLLNPQGTSGEEERTERRTRGHVHLYAMSNHGQDEVWIDARAVTVEEKTVKGGLEYIPYLWVGMATEGGGNSPSFTSSGNRNDMFRQIGLHVFEPLTDEELAQVRGSEDHDDGYHFYAGTMEARTVLELGGDMQQFGHDMPASTTSPNRINHSDDKLYYMGPGVAGKLAPDRESDDARLWQQAVCLDPDDPKKTITHTGPYMYGNYTYGGYPLGGVEWQMKGKVRPGKYLVKSNAWFEFNCQEVAGPDFTAVIKVIVGKAPGRVTTTTVEVPFAQNMWSYYPRDIYPQADGGSPAGPYYDFPGPNPHGPSWWQGGIEVDVQIGTISVKDREEDVVMPPWGFVSSSARTVKEICWCMRNYSTQYMGGVVRTGIGTGTNFHYESYGPGPCDCTVNAELTFTGFYGIENPDPDAFPVEMLSNTLCGMESGNSTSYSPGPHQQYQVTIDCHEVCGLDDPNAHFSGLQGGWAPEGSGEGLCMEGVHQKSVNSCTGQDCAETEGHPENAPPPSVVTFGAFENSPVTGDGPFSALVCESCGGTVTEQRERIHIETLRFPCP